MSDILREISKELSDAEARPRVGCDICGRMVCLDLSFTEKICEICAAKQEAQLKEESRNRLYGQCLEASGLPVYWHWTTFDKITVDKYNQHAIDCARKSGATKEGLALIGKPGRGKTTILAAICHAYCKRSNDTLWLKAEDLKQSITASWREKGVYLNPLQSILKNQIVIIDELTFNDRPPAFLSEAIVYLLDSMIEQRYHKLYISSNLTLQKLDFYLSPEGSEGRFAGRLKTLCKIVELGGSDWRAK